MASILLQTFKNILKIYHVSHIIMLHNKKTQQRIENFTQSYDKYIRRLNFKYSHTHDR